MEEQNFMSQIPMENQEVQVKPKSHWPKRILVILVSLLLLGGVAYGGWYGYENYWPGTPEKVFWQALQNFQVKDQMSISGEVNVVLTKLKTTTNSGAAGVMVDMLTGEDQNKFKFVYQTKYDNSQVDNFLSESSFDIQADDLSLSVSARSMEKFLYFKVLQADLFLSELGMMLPDKWVQVDLKKEAQEFLSGQGILSNDKEESPLENIFQAAYEAKPFILQTVDRSDNTLGKSAFVYTLQWQREGFDLMLQKFAALETNSDRREYLLDRLEPLDDKEWEILQKVKVKIWVTKDDKLLRQLEIKYNSDEKSLGANIDLTFLTNIQPLTEPLQVEKPVDFLTWDQLLEQLMGPSLSKSRDAKRIADIKQIQTALELYFADNNTYPIGLNLVLHNGLMFCGDKNIAPRGFIAVGSGCTSDEPFSQIYMNYLPQDPDFSTKEYVYTSIKPDQYGIKWQIDSTVGGLPAGILYATPEGIVPAKSEIIDSDNDKLSDDDEKYLYLTDPNSQDSDGDGYLDSEELNNGYNPLGAGKLSL